MDCIQLLNKFITTNILVYSNTSTILQKKQLNENSNNKKNMVLCKLYCNTDCMYTTKNTNNDKLIQCYHNNTNSEKSIQRF